MRLKSQFTAPRLLAALLSVAMAAYFAYAMVPPAHAADGVAPAPSKAPVALAPTAQPALSAQAPASKPLWSELGGKEQAALKPLAVHWEGMSAAQKRKWLTVSKDYDKLTPVQQAKLHARMTDWSSMSTQQRASARQNFTQLKELTDGLTPEQRKAQWQAYQELSPEQKRKLAESAPKPATVGAAPAIKPQPVLKKEPAPEFGTAKVLAKSQNAPQGKGKIAIAPHVQQQGAILPGQPPEAATR